VEKREKTKTKILTFVIVMGLNIVLPISAALHIFNKLPSLNGAFEIVKSQFLILHSSSK